MLFWKTGIVYSFAIWNLICFFEIFAIDQKNWALLAHAMAHWTIKHQISHVGFKNIWEVMTFFFSFMFWKF